MLTSVLCVCVVTNILHEGLHIVSFYLGCCTSNYNLPATLPPGEGIFQSIRCAIQYAERKIATSREGPMVSFDRRTIRTHWLPALPGRRSLRCAIRYAERKIATSREGPMVSFDCRTIRTHWLPALPGNVKFFQKLCKATGSIPKAML